MVAKRKKKSSKISISNRKKLINFPPFQIYSVVNGVVSVFIWMNDSNFNDYLIKEGLGEFCEENFLSKVSDSVIIVWGFFSKFQITIHSLGQSLETQIVASRSRRKGSR